MDNKLNNNENINSSHPCQYCSKSCFGLQCRECHMKMVEAKQGQCTDCLETFYAQRKDGSKRKRCKDCQEKYNDKYMSTCKCGVIFRSLFDDGREYLQCFKCYNDKREERQNKKCKVCEKEMKFGKQDTCSECFQATLEKEGKKCMNKTCSQLTLFSYCKKCNSERREINESYMISSCRHPECSYKGRGLFDFCRKHTETKG